MDTRILELQIIKCRKGEKALKTQGGKVQFYQSGGTTNKLGTGRMQDCVIDWKAINERMCLLRIKGRFFNYSIINVHSPHDGRPDDEKEAFYARLKATYDSCSPRDIKFVIGDTNAQVGREEMYRSVIAYTPTRTITAYDV